MKLQQRAKHGLKVVVAHALYYTGVLQLWKTIAMRNKAIVLMYHRVLTTEERARTASHPAVVIDQDTFDRQMAFLKRHFSVLSIDQFAHHLEQHAPLPDASIVITFDDGWRDNFTNALPVLRKHRLPALIFLPSNYIGARRLFWQEALTHLISRAITEVRRDPSSRPGLARLLAPVGLEQLLDRTDLNPRPAVITAVAAQKALTRAAVSQLIEKLAASIGTSCDEFADTDGFIDWQQVVAMSRDGISFGGHGVEHLLLTQVSAEEAESEIRGAKEMIDTRLNGTVPTFSFPNGYWTPALVERVRSSGYRLSFITKRGFVSCDDDPFTVHRLNVHESVTKTMPMFLARVVGLF